MLKIKKTRVLFEAEELFELSCIIAEHDERRSLSFLQKSVYDRISSIQRSQ